MTANRTAATDREVVSGMSPGKGEVGVAALSNGKPLIPDIDHEIRFARLARRLPADPRAGQRTEVLA